MSVKFLIHRISEGFPSRTPPFSPPGLIVPSDVPLAPRCPPSRPKSGSDGLRRARGQDQGCANDRAGSEGAWHGVAWHGVARHGVAWQGVAWRTGVLQGAAGAGGARRTRGFVGQGARVGYGVDEGDRRIGGGDFIISLFHFRSVPSAIRDEVSTNCVHSTNARRGSLARQ